MARKRSTADWKPDGRGRYRRMIGWREEGGVRVPQPFYLGTDLDQAKARYVRVKELWAHLFGLRREEPVPTDPLGEPHEPREYSWDGQGLWIARELAAGSVRIVLPRHQGAHESTYVYGLHELARKYPMVSFVPEDGEAYEQGQAFWKTVREHEQRRPPQHPVPLANAGPQAWGRLHEALDSYILHVKKSGLEPSPDGEPRLTAFGNLKVEQAQRIKGRQKDRPLSALDFHGCQELLDYWRLRPPTQPRHGKASKPMTRKTCENHVAELMRFFRWLHKSKDFDWRKPEDFADLDTKVKEIEDERTRVGHLNVKVYTDDELVLLNKYATPLERLLLLLGLNCGFKGAEQGTIRLEHLFLDRPHPHASSLRQVAKYESGPDDRFILYTRHKSGVYGEFLLWEQTVAGLRWAVARRKRICARLKIETPQLLLT